MKKLIILLATLCLLFSCNTQSVSDNNNTNIVSNSNTCEPLRDEILKELQNTENTYNIYSKYGWEIGETFYSTKTNSCVFAYSIILEKCSIAEIGFCDEIFTYVLDYGSKDILVNGFEIEVSDFDICEWAKNQRECNYQETIRAQLDTYR